mmetsp:Transcript_4118/g.6375  ORF Transcript_4118/g.6375 Transcript_4118/m.6375 type:complete len:527 (+) Transcript_4118:71-1651(+)
MFACKEIMRAPEFMRTLVIDGVDEMRKVYMGGEMWIESNEWRSTDLGDILLLSENKNEKLDVGVLNIDVSAYGHVRVKLSIKSPSEKNEILVGQVFRVYVPSLGFVSRTRLRLEKLEFKMENYEETKSTQYIKTSPRVYKQFEFSVRDSDGIISHPGLDGVEFSLTLLFADNKQPVPPTNHTSSQKTVAVKRVKLLNGIYIVTQRLNEVAGNHDNRMFMSRINIRAWGNKWCFESAPYFGRTRQGPSDKKGQERKRMAQFRRELKAHQLQQIRSQVLGKPEEARVDESSVQKTALADMYESLNSLLVVYHNLMSSPNQFLFLAKIEEAKADVRRAHALLDQAVNKLFKFPHSFPETTAPSDDICEDDWERQAVAQLVKLNQSRSDATLSDDVDKSDVSHDSAVQNLKVQFRTALPTESRVSCDNIRLPPNDTTRLLWGETCNGHQKPNAYLLSQFPANESQESSSQESYVDSQQGSHTQKRNQPSTNNDIAAPIDKQCENGQLKHIALSDDKDHEHDVKRQRLQHQ